MRTVQNSLGERGAATVEAAIAVGAIVLVLGIGLAGVSAVAAQLRCTDAAREAARLLARGEDVRVEDAVGRIAPAGAMLTVHREADTVHVDITATAVAGLPGIRIHGEAYAVVEPAADGSQTELGPGP